MQQESVGGGNPGAGTGGGGNTLNLPPVDQTCHRYKDKDRTFKYNVFFLSNIWFTEVVILDTLKTS